MQPYGPPYRLALYVKTVMSTSIFLRRLDSRSRSSSPLAAGGDIGSVDVNLWAWEVVRFKYKFFKAGEHEVSNKDATAFTENTRMR